MTKKQLNQLKREAAKGLLWGIIAFIIATIPVILFPGDDHTGSLMIWIISGMVIYDCIRRLWILNCKNPKEMRFIKTDDGSYIEY